MTDYRGLNEGGEVLCRGIFVNEQGALTNLTQDRLVVKIEKVIPDLAAQGPHPINKFDTIWTKEDGLLGEALPTPPAKEPWAAVETGEYRSFAADGCMVQADHLSRFGSDIEAIGTLSKNPVTDRIEIVHVVGSQPYPTVLWTRRHGAVNYKPTARPCHDPTTLNETNPPKPDPWAGRKKGMRCERCMWFVTKAGKLGRCRRHPPWPAGAGFPIVYETDWCGDFRLDEEHA